ncbi:SusC/RagA family TonB-linked outer membrane protein [Niastella caeni]|uniref:SusC/RagA family TonB-linked outer membrane protein n=1 Tax=Niastella caeni TaxID=2569763 RepID=A0A4S8HY56_9BACT|nr:SusC/RagA family TonB-linked outer membrane protein [Niastella caeni]THU39739.1 SusC/RagA family TonB-linked outer membrane protein [Niastella caeni]
MNCLRLPKLLLLLLGIGSSLLAIAQERTISGKVTDQQTKAPLEGVSIGVKGGTGNTLTNALGEFTLKIPTSESILTFSYVNYLDYQVKAGSGQNIAVTLYKVDKLLEDVVVVGYGTQKRSNINGAVATIKPREIEDLPVADLGAALINRLPGVGVSFASGKPGSTTTINIRNSSVFSGAAGLGITADPLYVIDNIVVRKEDFDNLDATLIEDITFLKDATAAIYGAAGAKGVVLVTTKRGKAGKPKISYAGYYGITDATVKPKVMSAYEHAKMLNDGYELTGASDNNRFSQADLEFLKTSPYKSWYDELWKPSSLNRHTLNVSGGTDKITFFAGANYYKESGNYGDISINKYGLRSGMNAKIIDGLTADVVFASDFSKDNRNTLKGASDETDDQMIRALFLTPQWVPLTINGNPVSWTGPNPPGRWNPAALFKSGNYKWEKSQGLSVNASLEYKPTFLKGLAAKIQFGKLNRNANHKEYFPPYLVYNYNRTGQNSQLYSETLPNTPTQTVSNSDQLGESTTLNGSYQLIGTLSYAHNFRNSDFDIMVGFDQGEGNSENVFFYKNGQLVPGVDEFWAFSNSGQTIRNPTYTASAKRSYLGRMNYVLLNKYSVQVIARYDGSSNFSAANRWGLFPSIGLGWKISEENFFRDKLPFISYMKLRANYGLVGEDRVNARLWESRFTQTTGMLFGTAVTNGLDPNVVPNPDITWEKSRTLNVGADVTLLKNKLNLTVDVYRRYSYDGYDNQSNSIFPPTAGVSAAVVNYGQSLSWGSEFSIGYQTKLSQDWGFSADVNFGFSNSMVLQTYYNPAYLGIYGSNELSLTKGRDPRQYNSSNFGYISKGILRTQEAVDALLAKNPNYLIGGAKPQVGFMDFEDINGDGKIDDNDVTTMFDRTTSIVGFGITFGVTYKSFKLQTNLNLQVGGKKFYDSEARKVPTTLTNAPSFWTDHWTPDNPGARYPRADAPLARENSTFWAVNGTVSHINNAVLTYSLPKALVDRLRLPGMKVALSGRNLLNIINPFEYKDPYTGNFAEYPTLRSVSLGVNVTL